MSASDKPLVIITRKLPEQVEARMGELFKVRVNTDDHPFSRAELVQSVADAEVLVPTINDRIDAALIEQAGPKLKLIANFGAGTDHIDVDAAHKKGIFVTNTPNVLNEDTADMAMALILAVPRRLSDGAQVLRPGVQWSGWAPTAMLGRRIRGKSLGIIGMGRIGTAVARRAKAFGLSIHYHNRQRIDAKTEADLEATYWPKLEAMLAQMDIISVNSPSTPLTRHMLNGQRLSLMKADAYIVNTARGDILDENALADAIEAGSLAGAGLDVFEHEPEINPRLLKLAEQGRIVLLPHMGSATIEARIDMGEKVIINIKTLVDGHRPPDRVLPQRG